MSETKERTQGEIVQILVKQIQPHPNNPRKQLGELEELAESIRARGILQNLTVVKHPGALMDDTLIDDYIAVIGHRRLAAAKLAGLETVPCIIADMDEQTQLSTMLMENIQRRELTRLEEAEGFQMMMDFGDTVESLAEKTGFGKSTIYKRIKLLKLDREELRKAEERGGTLDDYEKLDALKDPERKNNVLKTIGTNNFEHTLKSAIEEETRNEVREGITQQLDAFAEEADSTNGMGYVNSWYLYGVKEVPQLEAPEDAGEAAYYYVTSNYNVTLYREDEQAPDGESAEDEAARAAERERRQQLEDAGRLAYELRRDFVMNYSGSKKHLPVIYEMLVWGVANDLYSDSDMYFELMGIELGEDEEDEEENWVALALEAHNKAQEKSLLALAIAGGLDGRNEKFSDWNGDHRENEGLLRLYGWLEQLGYQMSDEEKALQDGTHELFTKAEKGEG